MQKATPKRSLLGLPQVKILTNRGFKQAQKELADEFEPDNLIALDDYLNLLAGELHVDGTVVTRIELLHSNPENLAAIYYNV